MKYELVGSWLIADGQTILFPGSRRDLKALAELVRRANAYDGLLSACKHAFDLGTMTVGGETRLPAHCVRELEAEIASAEGGAK